ncbi:MAG: PAQR family membrane homeostasis protein TrhA [Nitriliruptoraceae bacterium]
MARPRSDHANYARSPVRATTEQARPLLRGKLHAAAVVLLAASAPWLWSIAERGAPRLTVVVYLLGVGAMLAVSAVYHVPEWGESAKRALRRADHSAIFLGIAGTYTPLLLVATDGWFQTTMLAAIWAGAAAGIAIANIWIHARPWVVATPYVVLGWVSVLLLPALLRLSTTVTGLVIAGGVAYTLGAVVYARKRPDPWPRVFGFHELFHALTVVAVATHWTSVSLALQA